MAVIEPARSAAQTEVVQPIAILPPVYLELATGLGGAIGCDFRHAQNQLLFVEFAGKLSRLDLFPGASVVSSGTVKLKGTYTFDLDTGVEGGVGPGADIWWEQQTPTQREMTTQNGATLVNLGTADFNSITAANLQTLSYSATPIVGNVGSSNKLVAGDVFVVHTTSGNYAKVKILSYGYDLQIQWVTYHLNPAYAVLGTGYAEPEDVKLSGDGVSAYITERSGDLVRVSLTNANRSAATVIADGMTAPQQIALDEAHGAAYVVEYAEAGHLYRINLSNGTKTSALSGLENAVGVVLSGDLQYAYISEQTTGSDKGRVSRFRLSDGSRQPIVTGLTAPFFLTWLDAAQTSILVPERDPENRIDVVNVTAGTAQVVASVPFRPSSTALPNGSQMLVCSDQVISLIDLALSGLQPTGPLLMGIGFIPFDKITAAGLANTSVDPTYFYQVKDTPFGGALPIMINHLRAFDDGAVYYRIMVDSVVRGDSWTDEKWNGTQYVAVTTSPAVVAGKAGYYPVHPLSDLFLWLNPSLGSLLDSTNLSNGLHTIEVAFTDALGTILEQSTPLTIHVDNNHCVAVVDQPVLNLTTSADPNCGVLKYLAPSDTVSMAFTASHPTNFATFSFELIKGVNVVQVNSGPVTAVPSPIVQTVGLLLGGCTVAGFGEWLYVAATANNGWSRQSQYDASAAIAFVLAS